MSALDKLRRLRDRLGAKSVASNWSQEPGHRFVRMDDVDAEIDRLLAEPETPEPGAFIWQCACGSRNVVSSAVCTKCGNGRPNSALPLTGPNYLDQEEWGHEPAPSDTDTRMFPELRDLCGELEDRSVGADTIGIMYVRQRLEHAVGEAERKAARMLRGGAS